MKWLRKLWNRLNYDVIVTGPSRDEMIRQGCGHKFRRIKCKHEWVKYPRFLHDPTDPMYGKDYTERFKLENMTEDIWIPVGTKYECRLCGEYRQEIQKG